MNSNLIIILIVEFIVTILIAMQCIRLIKMNIPYRITGYGLVMVVLSVFINFVSLIYMGSWFNSISPFLFAFGIITIVMSFFVPHIKAEGEHI